MVDKTRRNLLYGLPALMAVGQSRVWAQAPLRLEITEGVIEPMPVAIPQFVAEGGAAADLAQRITGVVADDLTGSGLFREIPRAAHIGQITNFDVPVQYSDWSVINAQALITGAVRASDGRVSVRFRLWDVFAQTGLGEGLQFDGTESSWRRMGHKVADAVYTRLTGESGYFDSRVAYIAASGPKNARRKQLAIMDYDGANAVMLTDGSNLVLTPRLARSARTILYTSYEAGTPRIFLIESNGQRRQLLDGEKGITFAPRFSADEKKVVLSMSSSGGADIYTLDLATGARERLTSTASIDTAPCFSPDGGQIVFESDRGGAQQLYVMSSVGGEARRISFGEGRYATPVWSPRGDRIAFTKIVGGRFHIG